MEKFELLKAIYGPEGLECVEIENTKWYGQLEKDIIEDGDRSIYGYGYVLAVVRDLGDYKIAAGSVTGQDEVLQHFLDIQNKVEDIKKEWEEYKSFLKEKYPAEDGKEWELSWEHHKKIDDILK